MAENRSGQPLEITNMWDGNDLFYGSTQIPGMIRFSLNSRCTEGDCADRRKGIAVWGGGGDAGQVYASMVLQQDTDPDVLLRLVDGDGAGVQLQKYDPTDDEWDDLGSNIGTADDRTDWSWTYVRISGEDRVYFTNGVSDLQYTNGTTVSSVDGVKGRFITTKENILIIGCMTSVHDLNTVLYSRADSHVFYSDDIDVDYATSDQKFFVDGIVTGVQVFNWMVYVYTENDGLFEVDIAPTEPAPRKISTHGTMSPKSIAVGADSLFWADQYGVWQLPIGGDVLKISRSIDNLYSNVSGTNFYQLTGGVNTKQQYELHLGDLTYEGVDYTDVVLLYEIEQSRFYQKNVWRIDTGKLFANNIVTWANAYGFLTTFYGSRLTQTTYQTDYGYQDLDEDIAMVVQTKDFILATEKQEITLEDVYIRYEPLGSDDIPIVVKARMDTGSWVTIKEQDLPTSGNSYEVLRIQAPMGLTGRSVALRIESTSNLATKFKSILITYSYNSSEVRL